MGLPTIATLASQNLTTSKWLVNSLSHDRMRFYSSTDCIGLQIAGALKNVIAIAAGIATAKQLGENARAALIVRGLSEITRFGKSLGALDETFYGAAGMGDLMLSATSGQSRNFSVGLAIGQNASHLNQQKIGLTEGAFTARAILKRAAQLNIDMPICQAISNILDFNSNIEDEMKRLWNRPLK